MSWKTLSKAVFAPAQVAFLLALLAASVGSIFAFVAAPDDFTRNVRLEKARALQEARVEQIKVINSQIAELRKSVQTTQGGSHH